MKNKKLFPILALVISVLACYFVFAKNKTIETRAADVIQQDCYSLIDHNGEVYSSNIGVGKVEGLGKFIVGANNVTIKATANSNYKIKGWQITYLEQDNKTEFVDTSSLTESKKTIEMIAKDGETITSATIEFVMSNNVYQTSNFTIESIFENLKITPVFDYVYYAVEISDLVSITKSTNSAEIDGNLFYYQAEETDGDVTKYTNSYIKFENSYCYYGDLYCEDENYYTIHEAYTDTEKDLKVDYSLGAFRVGERVNISYNVNIIEDELKNSTNIDLVGASIIADATTELIKTEVDDVENSFKVEQDDFLRTKSFKLDFIVSNNKNQRNVVDFDYHNLYVVDLNIVVDGNEDHNEYNDIFGTIEEQDNEIRSNISIYNFYSKTQDNNLQFLVKKAQDNNSRSFGVVSTSIIKKTFENESYEYYRFKSLDNALNLSKYFTNISENITISLEYTSSTYNVDFVCKEYSKDGSDNVVLSDMAGSVLETLSKKRGEKVELDATSVAHLENIGYSFVGFADENNNVTEDYSYTINSEKPKGTTIYLCYQKIEYEVVFTNFNKVKIDNLTALNSVNFLFANEITTSSVTLKASNLSGQESITFANKLKIGDNLTITHSENEGFKILGYSLMSPEDVTVDDYLTTVDKKTVINFDADFIKNNNISNQVTIYVYEDIHQYELTYYIESLDDDVLGENVIMADISVETDKAYTISYIELDADNNEIETQTETENTIKIKIVVSDLKLNDKVKLISSPRTSTAEGAEAYQFNWFTEDGKSTLFYENVGNVYSHTATIINNVSIKVVYSMPSTKVMIALEEEFAKNANFTLDIKVVYKGEEKQGTGENFNVFEGITVGDEIEITLSNIGFGYVFKGYTYVEIDKYTTNSELTFTQEILESTNTILLDFETVKYHFIFTQQGGERDNEKVLFEGLDYIALDIDNSSVLIEKPTGYYVSNVKVNGSVKFSEILSETNEYRLNLDSSIYNFALDRENFIAVVESVEANEQNIIEILVDIEYSIFTYIVRVNYGITNPKSNNNYVTYPSLQLQYTYDGQTNNAVIDYVIGENAVRFINIPYSSQAIISVIGDATSGLSLAGWCYLDGTRVSSDDYVNSLQSLKIDNLIEDKTFVYNITYNAYYIYVNYISGQGDPQVKINNNIVNSNVKQITLYDKFEISANPIRDNGYAFDNITYKVPKYTQYNYSVDTWDYYKASLYVLNNGKYKLNTDDEYNQNATYYIFTQEEVVFTELTFVETNFLVSNYCLDSDGRTISFVINYKLIDLSIENNIQQSAEKSSWKLNGFGRGDAKIDFDLTTLATFKISAQDKSQNVRTITESDFVNFYDVVTITVEINKSAINKVDNQAYDMTLGLILSRVYINGIEVIPSKIDTGIYSVTFNVGQYMPADEVIEIDYELYIQTKTVEVTTIVKNSTTFYDNTKLCIDAQRFGFEGSGKEATGQQSFVHYLPFMAKANAHMLFTTDKYKTNFTVAGVKVYLNGNEIPSSLYEYYGIEKVDESGNVAVNARLLGNLKVEFIVQPNITYNNGPIFTKTFVYENNNAVAQKLSVGSTSDFDIQVDEMLIDTIVIKYVSTEANSLLLDSVTNVGRYNVIINFQDTADFDWLDEIILAEEVVLIIQPKAIIVSYNQETIQPVKKLYDATSSYNLQNVYKYLIFTDNNGWVVNYSDLMDVASSNLTLNNPQCYIATIGKDTAITKANENVYYNLYVYNLALRDNVFNRNFTLQNTDLIIYNYVQITKKPISLQNVEIYNKVYDGTDTAEMVSTENISISGIILGDDVSINISRLNPKFENNAIGGNKKVVLDAAGALVGNDISNYYIAPLEIKDLTIFPYSLSVDISGLGKVEVVNIRGLTEKDKVDLIPLNATFKVTPIKDGSNEYVSIYSRISKYLKGNNEFAIGYQISFVVNGEEVAVNNNLYLSIPSVKNTTGTYFLTGQKTGSIRYSTEDGNMIIDLSQIDLDVNTIFITKVKILLKPWQIILIIVGAVLLIASVVLVFVIIRKRKVDRDSVHEKI